MNFAGTVEMRIGVRRGGSVAFVDFVPPTGNALLEGDIRESVLETSFSSCRLASGEETDCVVSFQIAIAEGS